MIILILVAIMFYTLPCQAQRLDEEGTRVLSYIQKAMNFNRVTPQEMVYLHFDNMGYFENETMWFKAYVTRTDKRKATDLSKVLYVELLNPSGDVLKTTKWPIDSLGQANGDMKLDTLFGSGFYEVRAYTRYMTNWGVNACFSRVFPIFKAPKQEGDYHDLTIKTRLYKQRDPNNRDRSDSLYQKAIDEGVYTSELMKTVSVQFFPEGGDMIQGKRSRVAMLAVDDNGRPYQGEGFVMNAKGDVLASVTTDSLGRGLFDVTPDSTQLTFQLRNLKGKTQFYNLPRAKAEGVSLRLDAIDEEMLVTLQSSEKVCGRLLGFVVMNNGNITYCDTVKAEPLIEIELDRMKQREGVNQFTVFDSEGKILAERLYFIYRNYELRNSKSEGLDVVKSEMKITAKNGRLKPCGEVLLDVQTLPNSTFSFSAIDAQNMTNGKHGNIKTWMLLSSEVKGYINNVDYYFEADDTEHRKSADLLMMTQGWRRYDWELMSGQKKFEKVQPIEDKFYVFGKLNEYRKRNPANHVEMETFLYNEQGESLVGKATTDEHGNYAFEMPFVDGEWNMQIFTKLNDKLKTYYVGIDRQFSPVPRFVSPIESQILHPLKPNMFLKSKEEEIPEDEVFVPITERNHLLQNVTVKAKRRYFTNDDWRYKNEGYGSQYATLYYDIDKEREDMLDRGEATPTIFEFLCKKNALFGNPECRELPHPPMDDTCWWQGRLAYANRPVKWIVDNGDTQILLSTSDETLLNVYQRILGTKPTLVSASVGADEMFSMLSSNVGSTGDDFFPIWMEDIKHLYIVPYSPKENDGAVRVYLYTHKRFTTASNKGIRRTYFQGFNKPSTFKMEDYSVIPPMADFRRTIYWNPTIRTDSQGHAQVKFYNNSTCEEMYISAEGMSDEGQILVNE